MTPQRQLLFRLLHGDETHPTAEALYARASEQLPGISLRTVYQTLSDLSELGEINVFEFGTGSARFDPNVDDHHHVVCERCGQVRDVHIEAADDLLPADELDGFTISHTEVVFRGRCSDCHTSTNPTLHSTDS